MLVAQSPPFHTQGTAKTCRTACQPNPPKRPTKLS